MSYRSCTVLPCPRQCVGVQCLHVFADACSFLVWGRIHPHGCEVVPHCGLIHVALLVSGVEHLFTCLVAICVSALEKWLLKSFAHFFTWLFGFVVVEL